MIKVEVVLEIIMRAEVHKRPIKTLDLRGKGLNTCVGLEGLDDDVTVYVTILPHYRI